jgi:hypothetical protein
MLQASSNNLSKNNTTPGVKYQTTSSKIIHEKLFMKSDKKTYVWIIVSEYTKK